MESLGINKRINDSVTCIKHTHFPIRISILSSESSESACALVRLIDILKQLAPSVSFTWSGISRWQSSPHEVEQEIREADIVVIQRAFPHFETKSLLQWVLFESGKPVVYETDDQLTALPKQHPGYSYLQH